MMPPYRSFKELSNNETAGTDYRIDHRQGDSGIAIMAIHGGGIEPGVTPIADAVAGHRHSYYSFNGLKKNGNKALHITSVRFDEPLAISMAAKNRTVVTIHGCRNPQPVVYAGGLNTSLKTKIAQVLNGTGFTVENATHLPGINRLNICNRCLSGKGVQLEISSGLRHRLFDNPSEPGKSKKTPVFNRLVAAIRSALD
jgi:phage replication-related protein YjqB (UPF0714/DUF867 family)